MWYIYWNGQCVGTSESYVELPEGYTLSDTPPPPPPPPPDPATDYTPPVITRPKLSPEELTWCISNVPVITQELGELVLQQLAGEQSETDAIVVRLKELFQHATTN